MIPTLGLFEIVPRCCGKAIAATAWTEPLIAASNLAFLLTAVACATELRRRQHAAVRRRALSQWHTERCYGAVYPC
jgi:hypothetical protein